MSHPHYVFVNLKRFEIPRSRGGLSPSDDPVAWIRAVVEGSAALGIGAQEQLRLVYLLPEGLVAAAVETVRRLEPAAPGLEIGCQGVHWDDVEPGVNFGAFTSLLPATAAAALGARWAMLGHSEERRAKLQVLATYDRRIERQERPGLQAMRAIDQLIARQVARAFQAGMNVLLCVGETAEQRRQWAEAELPQGLEHALEDQLHGALEPARSAPPGGRLVVAYEPVWAIGPGKVPPDRAYIDQAASIVKRLGRAELGVEPPVVYGGGLKLENAPMLGSIGSIDGGLVALTRFTGDIGFEVQELAAIVQAYLQASRERRRA